MSDQVVYREAKFLVDQRYQIIKILGKGSYGTVCSAIDTKSSTKSNKPQIAIKKVNKIFHKDVLLKRAIRELKFMKHFNGHRNIVPLIDLDVIYTAPFDGLYCFQEISEFDLTKVIYSSVQFSEFHIQSFIYQILCGLKYIHSAEVIHRDLKPGNILVSIDGVLRICDFGLARGISSKVSNRLHDSNPITNYVATRWYRAPELMLSPGKYDKSIDMWAVGCILVELYGRKPLFIGKDQVAQIMEITKVLGTPSNKTIRSKGWTVAQFHKKYLKMPFSKLYPLANDLSIDLIEGLLQWDSECRLDVTGCLSHPFFSSIRVMENEVECSRVFDYSFEFNFNDIEDLKLVLQNEVEQFKFYRNKVHHVT